MVVRVVSVRLNCLVGQIALSEEIFLGEEMEISIIFCRRYYGNLGKTRCAEWLQLFFLPAPSCSILPPVVCVTYIKTRSLTNFAELITRLVKQGIKPAEGIFKINFLSHVNLYDQPYKSVNFTWRPRQSKAELEQLCYIQQLLNQKPTLIDLQGTKEMIPYAEYLKKKKFSHTI